MSTVIGETTVRAAIRRFVDEGTAESLRELSDLLAKEKRLREKRRSLYAMIVKHHGYAPAIKVKVP